MLRRHWVCFLSIFAFSMAYCVYPTCLTKLAEEFGRSPERLDWLFSANMAGFFVAMFICTLYGEKIGFDRLMTVGLFQVAVGLWLPTYLHTLSYFGVCALIQGFGAGLVEISAMSLVSSETEDSQRVKVLNFSQVFFCLGTVLGPWITGLLLQADISWRFAFRMTAIQALVIGVLAFTRIRPRRAHKYEEWTAATALAFLRNPLYLMLALQILLYVCLETGYGTFTCAYFEKTLGSRLDFAGSMLALYWIGIGLGRLALSYWHFPHSDRRLIIAFYSLGLVASIFLLLTSNLWVAALWIFLVGVGSSIVWPTIVAIVSKRFSTHAGPAISTLIGFGSLGGVLGGPLVGRVTAWTGSFRIGLIMPALLTFVCLGLFLWQRDLKKLK